MGQHGFGQWCEEGNKEGVVPILFIKLLSDLKSEKQYHSNDIFPDTYKATYSIADLSCLFSYLMYTELGSLGNV